MNKINKPPTKLRKIELMFEEVLWGAIGGSLVFVLYQITSTWSHFANMKYEFPGKPTFASNFGFTLIAIGPILLVYFFPWMFTMLVGVAISLLINRKKMSKKRRTPLFISNILLGIPLSFLVMVMTAFVYVAANVVVGLVLLSLKAF